ncbi:MAG: DUF885 domain-containing protein [Clostridium sp.]|nr:DUF885 domain-containing protein [Clostridium sp.]
MENRIKKRYGKRIGGALILAVTVLAGVLVFTLTRQESASPEQFDTFTEDLFRKEVVGNTINLHYTLAYPENYGIIDYEISLGDFSPEGLEESYQEMEELREKLASFDKAKLTDRQQVTYDILTDYVNTELSVKDLALYSEALSPTTGYQAQLPIVLAEYTFRTRKDIEDYLELTALVDDAMAGILSLEEKKAEAGLFMSDYAADEVIDQCGKFIENPEENYMIEVFNDKIDSFEGLSDKEKEEYRARNREIVTTEVVRGYQLLIDGLKKLKGSGTNQLGLCYYEDGKEYYEYLVRTGTGSDLPVKKLQRSTEKFVEDFFRNIQLQIVDNPQIYYDFMDYEFPITEPDAILQDLMSGTEEDFPQPPEVSYRIKYVHPSMEEHLSPAFYLTTPVDDLQDNVIYINGKYADSDETELYPTLAHEGYPGHLYQNVYTGSCSLPLVRSLFSFPGYTEGWATYVEYEYSYRLAGMEEALAQMFAGNDAATLALHAYIDMGIHYDGWNREDVAEYLAEFGISDAETTNQLFDMIVEEPGNYLSYFIGYLEIMNLQEKAQKTLGEKYSAKEFHRFLLEIGPAPFYIIEDYMDEWIERQ